MTERQVLTKSEIVELATRLRSLDRPLRLVDGPEIAADFGWKVVQAWPDSIMLDTGFGIGSGQIDGQGERVVEIEVWTTAFATEAVGREQAPAVFATLAPVLIGALGEPTKRVPGEFAQIRWAGQEYTLVLAQLTVAVLLSLVLNSSLAENDRTIELQTEEEMYEEQFYSWEEPPIDFDGPECDLDNQDSRLFYRGEPYTGAAIEKYPNGITAVWMNFLDGYNEGKQLGWYHDGATRYSGQLARNQAIGEWQEWFSNGRIKKIDFFDRPGHLASREKWDETGALIERFYAAGRPDDGQRP